MSWRALRERLSHEYWPWWLVYLPVVPFYLWQALRQRRAAFFTNVNPAIDLGGFFGESKWRIYQRLPEGSYPRTALIAPMTSELDVRATRDRAGIEFPLIVKPDIGERGRAVLLVHDEPSLLVALEQRDEAMLLQAIAPGDHEFGLMFLKDPDSGRTRLLSICGKRFLEVAGDGTSTVAELVRRTTRGRKQLVRLRKEQPELLARVPREGERARVEPIGNHCRGTRFVDGGYLRSAALERAVDELLSSTTGIHYGRIDVRALSEAELRAGRFTVIELNGVSSEPGQIYDPSHGIGWSWRELLRHVRLMGPLSTRLQALGHEPASLVEVMGRCATHFNWPGSGIKGPSPAPA
jgi:hypothetical protein